MPNNIIKSFAQRTGKSESEVETAWDKAKDITKKQYPEVEMGSEKFYKLLTGVLKKMLSIKTENEGGEGATASQPDGIKYSDVKPGTHVPFTTKHRQKRNLKKAVNEAYAKIPVMSKEELGVFNALQQQASSISITMLENAISTDQLRESIGSLRLGEVNLANSSDELLYLGAAINEAASDKQKFASFAEDFITCLFGGTNLNENSFEFPAYDVKAGINLISVKSSSSKHTVSEAFRNSNSIKSSALILSAMYRMSKQIFKENCSFKDISDLLEHREQIMEFVEDNPTKVGFAIIFVNRDGDFETRITKAVDESVVLDIAFSNIAEKDGNARNKFISSYTKLVEMCGGDTSTIITLSEENMYSDLREQLIDTIHNIKDYNLMKKIERLLR